jgi:hypothetical protein
VSGIVIGALAAIVAALIGAMGAIYAARRVGRSERADRERATDRDQRIAVALALKNAQDDTQAERDRILVLRDERIEELTEMIKELRIEIVRLRAAMVAAGLSIA